MNGLEEKLFLFGVDEAEKSLLRDRFDEKYSRGMLTCAFYHGNFFYQDAHV